MADFAYAKGPKKWFMILMIVFLIAIFAMPVGQAFFNENQWLTMKGRVEGREVTYQEFSDTWKMIRVYGRFYRHAFNIYYALLFDSISQQEQDYAVWTHFMLTEKARQLRLYPGPKEVDEFLSTSAWNGRDDDVGNVTAVFMYNRPKTLREMYNEYVARDRDRPELKEETPYSDAYLEELLQQQGFNRRFFRRVMAEFIAVNRYTALIAPPPIGQDTLAALYQRRYATNDLDLVFVPLAPRMPKARDEILAERLLASARRKLVGQTLLWRFAPQDGNVDLVDPWFRALTEETPGFYDVDRQLIQKQRTWASRRDEDTKVFRQEATYHISYYWHPIEKESQRYQDAAHRDRLADEIAAYYKDHRDRFPSAPDAAPAAAAEGEAAPKPEVPTAAYREIERYLIAKHAREDAIKRMQEVYDAFMDPAQGAVTSRKRALDEELALLNHRLRQLDDRLSTVTRYVQEAITGATTPEGSTAPEPRADSVAAQWSAQRSMIETVLREYRAEHDSMPTDDRADFWTANDGARRTRLAETVRGAVTTLAGALDRHLKALKAQIAASETARNTAQSQLDDLKVKGGADFSALTAADQAARERHEYTLSQKRALFDRLAPFADTWTQVNAEVAAAAKRFQDDLAAQTLDIADLQERRYGAFRDEVNRLLGVERLLSAWAKPGETFQDEAAALTREREGYAKRRGELTERKAKFFSEAGQDNLNLEIPDEPYPFEEIAKRHGVEFITVEGPRTIEELKRDHLPAARELLPGAPGASDSGAGKSLQAMLDVDKAPHRLTRLVETPGRGFAVVLLHARQKEKKHTLATRPDATVDRFALEERAMDSAVEDARRLRARVIDALAGAPTAALRREGVARALEREIEPADGPRWRRVSFDGVRENDRPIHAPWIDTTIRALKDLPEPGSTTSLQRVSDDKHEWGRGVVFAVLIDRHDADLSRARYVQFEQVRTGIEGDYFSRYRQRMTDFFTLLKQDTELEFYPEAPR